jgi:hypothetical protein
LSGTLILAAERTGRIARLIELDPLYVDVAIRRWEKITGVPARHATSGETPMKTSSMQSFFRCSSANLGHCSAPPAPIEQLWISANVADHDRARGYPGSTAWIGDLFSGTK